MSDSNYDIYNLEQSFSCWIPLISNPGAERHISSSLLVITNDIYTKEDAQFLAKNSVLPVERIIGVETGGCPHTAIREDASMNIEAVDEMMERFPDIELLFYFTC